MPIDAGTAPPDGSASADASSSSMKNGMPSLRSTTASSKSAGTISTARHSRSTSSDCDRSRGPTLIETTARRASRALTVSLPSPASPSLMVATTSAGCPAKLSARYSKTFRVSGSDQCRSSITRTVADFGVVDHSAISRSRPSASMIVPRSAPGSADPAQFGTTAPRAGRNGRRASEGWSPLRSPVSSASRNGRSGTSIAVGLQRPVSMIPPESVTCDANSRTSRLLPIPAAPWITTS